MATNVNSTAQIYQLLVTVARTVRGPGLDSFDAHHSTTYGPDRVVPSKPSKHSYSTALTSATVAMASASHRICYIEDDIQTALDTLATVARPPSSRAEGRQTGALRPNSDRRESEISKYSPTCAPVIGRQEGSSPGLNSSSGHSS